MICRIYLQILYNKKHVTVGQKIPFSAYFQVKKISSEKCKETLRAEGRNNKTY